MGTHGLTLTNAANIGKNDFNLSFLNYETSIHNMYSGID